MRSRRSCRSEARNAFPPRSARGNDEMETALPDRLVNYSSLWPFEAGPVGKRPCWYLCWLGANTPPPIEGLILLVLVGPQRTPAEDLF